MIQSKSGLGCGHAGIAIAETAEEHYQVNPADVLDMQQRFLWQARKPENNAAISLLRGNHLENGVWVVDSPDLTVDPGDGFRYDRLRHYEGLGDVASLAREGGVDVDTDRLVEVTRVQAEATLERLASQLPRFLIDTLSEDTGRVRTIAA